MHAFHINLVVVQTQVVKKVHPAQFVEIDHQFSMLCPGAYLIPYTFKLPSFHFPKPDILVMSQIGKLHGQRFIILPI